MLAVLSVLAFVGFAAAQNNFRVGDVVETDDGRVCSIESITGSSARVKCGANRADIRVYSFGSLVGAKAAELKREQQKQQKQQEQEQREQQQRDAPSLIFKQGDTVQTQDGRTGKIEDFKDQEMAKVRFGFAAGDAQYFMLTSLKVVKAPKPVLSGPSEVFKVGDLVVNSSGQQLRIDSIEGDTAVVRYGVGKYNVYKIKLSEVMSSKTAAAKREDENADKLVRVQFEDDAQAFEGVIRTVAVGYDPKYRLTVGFTPEAATYEKWTRELTGLSVVCQKYPNLTSRPDADADNIRHNVADWCRIAEQRTAVVKRMQIIVGEQRINSEIQSWTNHLDQALRNSDGTVDDGVQMLLYDRPSWEQKELKYAKKIYADAGATMPTDALKPLEEKIAELKAKIEREAPTRSWEVPQHKDPALEAMVGRSFPTKYPGGKLFRTGMTYATWKSIDDTSLVSIGTDYKLYRTEIGKYRFKNGRMLVKLPNQPFCQSRMFSVEQTKSGGGYSGTKLNGLGSKGIFVKCP